jgi:hypothetical protein
MSFSRLTFKKWRLAVCTLAQDFSQEQDFLERNLLQHASRTPEWRSPLEHLKIREKNALREILLQRVLYLCK